MMRSFLCGALTLAAILTATASSSTAYATEANGIDNSLYLEAKTSMNKAEHWLIAKQNEDGSWGDKKYGDNPAYTALAITALASNPAKENNMASAKKGAEWLKKFLNPDGSICVQGEHAYPNYTTACAITAFFYVDAKAYGDIISKGRAYLVKSQFGPETGPEKGGIGYGSDKSKADLSNTQFALEALYITESVDKDKLSAEEAKQYELCWERATDFLTRCQLNKQTNPKVEEANGGKSVTEKDEGAFQYSPDRTKTDEKQAERGYGSMTYAGLKSMIYAKVNKDDPRIKSAIAWLEKNYSVSENPGLGSKGLYYYYHTMAKALHTANIDSLKTPDGKTCLWRADLTRQLLSSQQGDGSWVNTNNKWQENDPLLVTTFTIMALQYTLANEATVK